MGDGRELRRIPAVDALLREPGIEALRAQLAPATIVALIRDALDETRRAYLSGECGLEALASGAIVARVTGLAAELVRPALRRVLNATGILIHTNLGRAPWCASAQQAASQVLGGYSNLELDLQTGRRTSRLSMVRELLRRVTGAPDALAVNNNAAAVCLSLHTLAAGHEVIVSRGELVEIGGSFRLPDIMQASGARLREVGTTNRTRISDYAEAIGPQTGLILKVHPSNFVVQGFSECVTSSALAALAHEHGLVLMEDIGSGALEQHPAEYLRGEPRVQAALRAGVDLLCFSGDKLLGGPQAGLILGRTDLIAALHANPMARVVRLDKLHLAALEATLREYLRGPAGLHSIPLYRMMTRTTDELRAVGTGLLARLAGVVGATCELVETKAAAGGGTLPGETLSSIGIAVALEAGSIDALAERLRVGDPAVIGRIERDRLILDLRTLSEDEWGLLADVLVQRLGEGTLRPED